MIHSSRPVLKACGLLLASTVLSGCLPVAKTHAPARQQAQIVDVPYLIPALPDGHDAEAPYSLMTIEKKIEILKKRMEKNDSLIAGQEVWDGRNPYWKACQQDILACEQALEWDNPYKETQLPHPGP